MKFQLDSDHERLNHFFKSLSNTRDEDRITSEKDLKLAEGRQKLQHRNQKLELELEKQRNNNDDLKTDRTLKIIIAFAVFVLLYIETALLFCILFFQGFGDMKFHVDESTLNILVPATILQISSMAIIITRYLFAIKSH